METNRWLPTGVVASVIFCQGLIVESLGLQMFGISRSLGSGIQKTALIFPAKLVGVLVGCLLVSLLHHQAPYRLKYRLLVIANFGVFLMGTSIGFVAIARSLTNVLTVVWIFGIGNGIFLSCIVPHLIRIWRDDNALCLQIVYLFLTLGQITAHVMANRLFPTRRHYDTGNNAADIVYGYSVLNDRDYSAEEEVLRLIFPLGGIVVCVSGMVLFCYAMKTDKKILRIDDATDSTVGPETELLVPESKPDWTLTSILFLSASLLNFVVQNFPNFVKDFLISDESDDVGVRVPVIMKLVSIASVLFQIPFIRFDNSHSRLIKINLLTANFGLVILSLLPTNGFCRWFSLILLSFGNGTTFANTLTWANSRTNLTPRIMSIFVAFQASVEFVCSLMLTKAFNNMPESVFYICLLFGLASLIMYYTTETAEWIVDNESGSQTDSEEVLFEQSELDGKLSSAEAGSEDA